MPYCPVCGKEVQATTIFCPACGTSLKQESQNVQPSVASSQEYYSSSYRPGRNRISKSRGRIWMIIVALLIGLFVGALIGFEISAPVDYTFVTGQVNLNNNQYHGAIPHLVYFNSTMLGNFTSAVGRNGAYYVNLPTGDTYQMSIEWYNATGSSMFGFCKSMPSSFNSNQRTQLENLSC